MVLMPAHDSSVCHWFLCFQARLGLMLASQKLLAGKIRSSGGCWLLVLNGSTTTALISLHGKYFARVYLTALLLSWCFVCSIARREREIRSQAITKEKPGMAANKTSSKQCEFIGTVEPN